MSTSSWYKGDGTEVQAGSNTRKETSAQQHHGSSVTHYRRGAKPEASTSDREDRWIATDRQHSAQDAHPNYVQTRLCVICQKRPCCSANGQSYQTCGYSCGEKLQEARDRVNAKCVVCNHNSRYSRGGVSYPTCSLSCAAELERSDKVVNFRDLRSTHNINGEGEGQSSVASHQRSPQGIDCVRSRTNSSCLQCWMAEQLDDLDFCSEQCKSIVEHNAPRLLEAPRGHITFQNASAFFDKTWVIEGPRPEVTRLYKIVYDPAILKRLRAIMKWPHPSNGNARRWHGTKRTCRLGDPSGDRHICSSGHCLVCLTINNPFGHTTLANGFMTSSNSSRGDDYAQSVRGTPNKTMLLIEIEPGKEIPITRSEAFGKYERAHNHTKSSSGDRSLHEEPIEFAKVPIKSVYLVFYA